MTGGPPGPIPLSVVQEDLWYLSQLAPDNPVYNELFTIRKTGGFNRDAFKRAFNELVRRHEAWRTTFLMMDEQPAQVVQPPPIFDLPVTDLSNFARRDAEGRATEMAAELARQPFRLDKGPLLRPLLVRFGEDEHRLYLALHHLIVDAVSLNRVVLPELVAIYDSLAADEQPALSEPSTQYADYARWSQEWAKSEAYARRMEYWRGHLLGVPELRLPLDHPRPRQQRFRGGMECVRLSEDLVRRLRSLGLGEGATMFQVFASAFAILLHRYAAGQDDVVFGIVSDLRQRSEFENVLGYCFNSVVVRAELGGDPSFRQLLGRLRTELLDDLARQVPFGRLVGDLQPPRDASINPFFQAMLVLLPTPSSTDNEWSLYQEAELGNAVGTAKLDLTLQLDERPEGHIDARLIYNSDLFDAQTAQRVTGHWLTLLECITNAPDRRLSQLALLTDAEIQQQLVGWNDTDADLPLQSCVHELIAEQVYRTPSAIAVTDGGAELSYMELNERAARLATHLRENGVGPDVCVGVCLDRSLDLVVAILAVLKAGGAFVPLEPDQPRERLAHMIDDARPRVVLTTARLEASLPPTAALLVRLDVSRESWMARPESSSTDCMPSNLAYVLFTSGSTGTPKGVMIEHRSIVNQLLWRVGSFGLGPGDRVLQKTPLGFDVSLWELFSPLMSGATVVMLAPGAHADPTRIAATVRAEQVTALDFVPSMLEVFLDTVDVKGCESVRLVAASGERLTAGLCARFFESFGHGVSLRNLYGPTEAAVVVTSWECRPGEIVVPIGRPVANTQIYILDSHMQPVPIGAPGELCIGGVGVARGYLNRPELTAERFVPNPYRAGERIYRTGDVARFRNDGAIEYLGRRDDQVKVRGNRIELGEIEATLVADDDIAAAVVVVREEAPGDQRLVAYLVPKGKPPPTSRLMDRLRRSLPAYMLPAAFVTLDAWPLTPNGKLDRKALPPPTWERTSSRDRTPPRSRTEERLAMICARILKVEAVGVNDDFFELGGHSLLAVRLIVEVQREFGIDLPLAAFLEGGGTLSGLATTIESIRGSRVADPLTIAVQPGGTTPILFFIHADESSMLTLRHFIRPLGAGQRVIGLLPDRSGRRFDRTRSIEELASTMLRSIRQAQPNGPYFLAGYSLGGLLAYEVAGRLQAEGDYVGWLGVLDSATPAAGARYQKQRLSMRQRLARQRARGLRGATRKSYEVLRREARAALVRLHLRQSEMSDEFDWRGARVLVDRYACPPNDVAMDLFVTAERAAGAGSPSLGWSDLHRGVLKVHRFGGDHRAMVTEPQVSEVAAMVARSVQEAMRSSPGVTGVTGTPAPAAGMNDPAGSHSQ